VKQLVSLVIVAFCPGLLFAGPLFVPGDPQINEKEILERMVDEIGETGPNHIRVQAKAVAGRRLQEARRRNIIFEFKDGSRGKGDVVMSQHLFRLAILPDERLITIPLAMISKIEFQDWKPVTEQAGRKVFFPSLCKVSLRTGETVSGRPDMEDWLQFYVDYRVVRVYYSVEGDAKDAPETLVTRIEFGNSEGTLDAASK